MKYIVASIKEEKSVVGKFGPQIRTSFRVEGDERDLSAFSKFPFKVGDEIEGTITQKDQWWNFKFAPKTYETTPSPTFQPQADGVRSERKLDAILTEIQMIKTVLGDILSKVDKAPFNEKEPF